jgi:hypothetical protein
VQSSEGTPPCGDLHPCAGGRDAYRYVPTYPGYRLSVCTVLYLIGARSRDFPAGQVPGLPVDDGRLGNCENNLCR